jgi:lipid-binding SYLF domain-containing protein
MTRSRVSLSLVALVALTTLSACQTTPPSAAARESLKDDSQATLNRFMREDPGLKDFLNRAHGYVVFPEIGKGGLIVGAAYGRGRVYEQGRAMGYADMSQASIGAQIGGETYSEIISFQTPEAFNNFKANQLTFAANASAVAIKTGASAAAKYENGVAVFTMTKGGLMAEASVGGQKFTYISDADVSSHPAPTTMP